jgi:hypothetical protein
MIFSQYQTVDSCENILPVLHRFVQRKTTQVNYLCQYHNFERVKIQLKEAWTNGQWTIDYPTITY